MNLQTIKTKKMTDDYEIPIIKVSVIKDGTQGAKTTISNPESVFEILQSYLRGADREHFVIMLLNTKNEIIGINTVSIGNLNSSIVHPREVFKPAIIAGANAIIAGHNHPSGNPYPSQNDIDVTKRLGEAGELLGIPLIDHVIIGDNRYFSLKENNLL